MAAVTDANTYPFFICDVFSRDRFGGNPLAVLPRAEGLDGARMQQIAREFNFSETTFVFPAKQGGDREVRIFTPAREVPFAGHPNLGTAFVLAESGELGMTGDDGTVQFEEAAGTVPVRLERQNDGRLWTELTAPQPLSLGPAVMPELAAAALSLEVSDIRMAVHPPRVAGVGLPFLIVELQSREALGRAVFNEAVMSDLVKKDISPDILLYARQSGDFDIRARMFAPIDGVPEDPATGSANAALAALLAHCEAEPDGAFRWRIAQGVEMGRPSILHAAATKRDGRVTQTRIGGYCVMVAEGRLTVD
jgi:trans-2,3-dihydro-3-hydroxyanthranilate isomerase